jgi:hypothetical protein
VRPDFCGWSALGPISLFLENVLGFREINGLTRSVVWDCPDEPGSLGIRNLRFGEVCADLLFENGKLTASANLPFTLIFRGQSLTVSGGRFVFSAEFPTDILLHGPWDFLCIPAPF